MQKHPGKPSAWRFIPAFAIHSSASGAERTRQIRGFEKSYCGGLLPTTAVHSMWCELALAALWSQDSNCRWQQRSTTFGDDAEDVDKNHSSCACSLHQTKHCKCQQILSGSCTSTCRNRREESFKMGYICDTELDVHFRTSRCTPDRVGLWERRQWGPDSESLHQHDMYILLLRYSFCNQKTFKVHDGRKQYCLMERCFLE